MFAPVSDGVLVALALLAGTAIVSLRVILAPPRRCRPRPAVMRQHRHGGRPDRDLVQTT